MIKQEFDVLRQQLDASTRTLEDELNGLSHFDEEEKQYWSDLYDLLSAVLAKMNEPIP